MKRNTAKRYSQAFKQKVVKEYEAGASIYQLREKYGIGSHMTIQRWVEQYSRSGYRSEKVIIQTVEDQLEFKAMKSRISELEKALAEQVLENRILNSILETAGQSLDMDLKKTYGRRR